MFSDVPEFILRVIPEEKAGTVRLAIALLGQMIQSVPDLVLGQVEMDNVCREMAAASVMLTDDFVMEYVLLGLVAMKNWADVRDVEQVELESVVDAVRERLQDLEPKPTAATQAFYAAFPERVSYLVRTLAI
jgi:hypothetical protein